MKANDTLMMKFLEGSKQLRTRVFSVARISKDKKKGVWRAKRGADLGLCVAPPIGLEPNASGDISRIPD